METKQQIDQREKDIQNLCKQVLNISANVYYNPNGSDDTTCPICGKISLGATHEIADIKHTTTCGYLIAKDLLTNLPVS